MPSDATLITLGAMLCVTTIAAMYDGQLALIAVGALIGLLGGHGLGQAAAIKDVLPTLVNKASDPPAGP